MAALRSFLLRRGIQTRVTSTYRTHSEQARLYARWRAGLSRLPAAPPGTSAHERGLAFDLAASPEGLQTAGKFAPLFNLRWGGRFSDPVHFEAIA